MAEVNSANSALLGRDEGSVAEAADDEFPLPHT